MYYQICCIYILLYVWGPLLNSINTTTSVIKMNKMQIMTAINQLLRYHSKSEACACGSKLKFMIYRKCNPKTPKKYLTGKKLGGKIIK